MSERHVFIQPGISREAFTTAGIKATVEDEELTYLVHEHKHDPYGDTPCNDRCTLIKSGIVATNATAVTLLDDAIVGGGD